MYMQKHALATFGSGCFWCSEAVFRELRGVTSVVSGYSGGVIPRPTYEQVCSEGTEHAEVIQITFDPAVITYRQLVEVFFATHDPTQVNRQGPDIGPRYRSVIFFHDLNQKNIATKIRNRLVTEKVYSSPVVTDIEPAKEFYPAEAYHQRYFEKHPDLAYCQVMINPKIAKFRAEFAALRKSI